MAPRDRWLLWRSHVLTNIFVVPGIIHGSFSFGAELTTESMKKYETRTELSSYRNMVYIICRSFIPGYFLLNLKYVPGTRLGWFWRTERVFPYGVGFVFCAVQNTEWDQKRCMYREQAQRWGLPGIQQIVSCYFCYGISLYISCIYIMLSSPN